jgi:hypothetical protein
MSDRLSQQLQSVKDLAPRREEDPDKRLIEALGKALDSTTPDRAGCPWDKNEEENERSTAGQWFPEGD